MSAQIEMRSVAEIVRDMLLQPRLNWIEEYAARYAGRGVGGGENPRVNGDESVFGTDFILGWGRPRLDRGCGEGNRPLISMVQDGCPATLCKPWPTAPAFGGLRR